MTTDATNHWQLCADCGYTTTSAPHGNELVNTDATNHWHQCPTCKKVLDTVALHTYDNANDTTCNDCGYTRAATSFTVSFRTPSGVTAPANQTVDNGTAPTTPSLTTPNGWTFMGWTTTATNTCAYTGQTGLSQTISAPVTANITYYAIFRQARTSTTLTGTLRSNVGVALADTNTVTSGYSILGLFTNQLSSAFGSSVSRVRFGSQSGSAGRLYHNAAQTSNVNTSNDYVVGTSGSYPLNAVYFQPSGTAGTWSIAYTAYDAYGNTISGTLTLTVPGAAAGSVTYTTPQSTPVLFNAEDFNSLLRTQYSNATLSYVAFTGFNTNDGFDNARGYIYYNYGSSGQTAFTSSTIRNYRFYYGNYSSSTTAYPLSALSFVPGTNTSDYSITLTFTAYATTSGASVTGNLVLNVSATAGVTATDIVYSTTSGKVVPIRATDLSNFFSESYPSDGLEYVVLRSVPTTGTLYYNYDGSSRYGSTSQVRITSSNYSNYRFYLEPASTREYALSALTYVPNGSDYCITIPFTAYGSTTSRNVRGSIFISVTDAAVAEVYALTTASRAVALDGNAIYSAVRTATGQNLSYIQFVELPTTTRGTLYYTPTNNTTQRRVTTDDTFRYSGTGATMSTLSFTPRGTGSVDLPYIAYTSGGRAIAYGNVAIGVVSRVATYTDMGASSWYYKYVVELSDAGVINGMPDGSYAGTRAVTYGEALKLILLATGRSGEQAKQAGRHWAAGYMDVAIRLGLLAGEVDLSAPISRQNVATLAAGAMRLTSYPATSPFVDTTNSAVLRLYEAGIVEGSVGTNGAMYFYPNGTLTRAEVATIVWRINKAS